MQESAYAHPEVLVSTEWVALHQEDPEVRIAESDEDYLLYEQGHVPGALKVDWFTILQDPVRRDFIDKAGFEKLMEAMDRQAQIERLLNHYEDPQHKRVMNDPDAFAEAGNPGCGNIVRLYLKFDGDALSSISFAGEGCTISQASADILAGMVEGQSIEELEALSHEELMEALGEEIVQNRTRCALLSLDTLKVALRKYQEKQVPSSNRAVKA